MEKIMFSTIISFVSSPIGGLVAKVLGGFLLLGIVLGLYKIHNDGIRREAMSEHNRAQLEQVVTDQRRFIQQLEAVNNLQLEALGALQRQNDTLNARLRRVTDYLNSPQAQANNRASSEVLRNTIRQLGEER
jgi:hypothetical protein